MLHLNQLGLPIAHVHHVSPTFKILITLRFFNICSNISSDRSFRFDNQINIFHLVNLRIIALSANQMAKFLTQNTYLGISEPSLDNSGSFLGSPGSLLGNPGNSTVQNT